MMTTIRPELLSLSSENFQLLMPYFCLFFGIILAIIASIIPGLQPKWPVFLITLTTCAATSYLSYHLIGHKAAYVFNDMMVCDSYSNFFSIVFGISAFLTGLATFRYLDRELLQYPEFYILMMFSTLGMMLLVSALDLIVLFIALEIMSLSVYVLVGFRRADRRSNEASLKYFILGSAASAILLYGTALLYGSTGSTGMRSILSFIHSHSDSVNPVFALGCGLVLVGLLFKVASVPFHMWMPDVYEGAPVTVTGFMTTGLKAAAFATLVRVYMTLGLDGSVAGGLGGGFSQSIFHALQSHVHHALWVSAALTMALGNFVALTQTNLKRMLAYSSIAHSGYLLMGIVSASHSELGYAPILLYLVVYSMMNLGAFTILSLIASRGDSGLNLHDLSGLARRHPWMAFSMSVFLFSMSGIPPTAGFMSKYYLFYSAVQAGEIPLVVIGVICSAVSVYYYLRVVVYMYMREPIGSPAEVRISIWPGFALLAMVVMVISIGILPSHLVDVARHVFEVM